MFIFMNDAAEEVASADVEVRDRARVGERFGEWAQGSGVRDAPMRPVRVVVPFVLVQRVQQGGLVPDQRPVQ
jgi:hypothetical protein